MTERFVQRLAMVSAALGLKTKAQQAKALGVGRTTLFYYETDPSSIPEHVVQKLSELERNAITLDEHSVQSSVVREEGTEYGVRIRSVPVVGWVHAGEAESYEEIPRGWQSQLPTDSRDPKCFAVQLEGDSMADNYQEGDILFVQPSEEPYSGCLAICKFANDGLLFRRVEFYPDKVRLVALNQSYPPTEHPRSEFSWIYPVYGRWSQIWKR